MYVEVVYGMIAENVHASVGEMTIDAPKPSITSNHVKFRRSSHALSHLLTSDTYVYKYNIFLYFRRVWHSGFINDDLLIGSWYARAYKELWIETHRAWRVHSSPAFSHYV